MKRQINLYGAEFRPKRQWASLNQMALVWGFALLLILLTGVGYSWQQQQVSRSADQAGEQVAAFFINANHVKVGLGRQGVGEPMPNNSVVVQ